MKKLLLLWFFVLFNIMSSWGQVEIGTGTDTQRFPLGNHFGFDRSASIYTAAEVQSVGNIQQLAWYATVGERGPRPIKIYLKESTASVLTSVPWSTLIAGATLVYEGTMTPVVGWNSVSLMAAFNYTGNANNLMVLVEANFGGTGNGGGANGNAVRYSSATNKHLTLQKDNTPSTDSDNGTLSNNRPNIKMTFGPAETCFKPRAVTDFFVSGTRASFTVTPPITVPAMGYEYELRTSGLAGSGPIGLVTTALFTDVNVVLSGLATQTAYVLYIRSKCSDSQLTDWLSMPFTTTGIGQIGGGETTSTILPIRPNFGYNYSQQIYLKGEVVNAVGENNIITKIKFHFKSATATATYKDWRISMGNTNQTEFSVGTAWVPQSRLSQVFDGVVTFPNPTDDWMEIELTTPFIWDGVSNLVVAVHEYTPGFLAGGVFRKSDTVGKRGMITGTDTVNPDPQNLSSGTSYNYVPQLILEGGPLPACQYPLNVESSELTSRSVKYNWKVVGTNPYLGTEYFYSTSETVPTQTTVPTGLINQPVEELVLSGLSANTTYYIWFRVKCNASTTSEWSAVSTFTTLPLGQIGTGQLTSTTLPMRPNFGYNYSQQIYLKAEVVGAVGTSNLITKVKFHFTATTATDTYKDWKIYMGNTNQTEFATTSSWVNHNQLSEVFDGVVTFPTPTDNWMEIELTTPFIWDGVSNLVVAVHEFTPGFLFGGAFRKMDTAGNRGIITGTDMVNPDPQNLTSGATYTYVPQLTLVSRDVPTCVFPINVVSSDLRHDSIKYSWDIYGTNPYLGTEYFYSTSATAPTQTTQPSGIVSAPGEELALTGLNENTQYYIWFRVKCNATTTGEWSTVYKFRTNLIGQIGTGELVGSELPLRSSSAFNYSQQIYLKDEITAAIGTDNVITKIQFHLKSAAATANYKDWKIFIGNTNQTEFATGTSWIAQNQLEQVFDGEVSFPNPTVGDWMEIELTTPFIWDGESNLVIAVNEYTPDLLAGAVFRKINTINKRGMGVFGTANPNLQSLNSGTSQYYVPQIVLHAEPAPPCLAPLNLMFDHVTNNSVKYTWSIFGTAPIVGVEYYLSTSDAVPDPNTDISGEFIGRVTEGVIQGLNENTRYYIWFRVKCNATETSQWTEGNTFVTNPNGLIGTGETTATTLPVNSSFSYNYSQQIYLASEVTGVIGTERYIKKVRFHYKSTTANATYKDWKIYMGNTAKAAFGATTATEWIPTSQLTTVFDGEVTFPADAAAGDWMEITLAEPFLWDGTSNIVVGVYENTPGNTAGATFRRMNTGTNYRGLLYRVDAVASNPNPNNPPAASERFQYVPQVVLIAEPAPSCVGVSSYSFSDLTINSVKVQWTNSTTVLGTEYFYATSLAQAPIGTTAPMGTVNVPNMFANLTALIPDTQYYVWFRNKCTATESSAWSAIPMSFKTLVSGFVGSGVVTTAELPMSSNWDHNYTQQIYLASEISSAAGATTRQAITKLKFHIRTTSATATYKDWKVFMGNTAKTEFTATSVDQWVPITAMQQVFDGEVTYPVGDPIEGWLEITFTEPFIWDGTSNIVIGVHEYTPSRSAGANFRRMDTPGANRGFSTRSDITVQNPANPGVGTRYTYVPQIIFETGVVPACLKPTYLGVNDVTKNTATMNWTAPITVPTNGYEYEVRTAGAAGSGAVGRFATEILGNTILTKALTGLVPATEYSVYIRSKCSATTNSEWTLATKFTTLCNYTDFTVENAAICGQGTVNLTVTVTGTTGVFKWYDVATGGVVLSEGLTFTTPLLTANKSYWVEGTTGTGNDLCLSGRKKIDVVVSPAPAVSLSTLDVIICEGETSSVVTVTSDLATYNTYTWSPAAGVSGNAQTGWVFNPTVSTEYTLIAKQTSGDFCEVMKKVNVVVKLLPAVTFSPIETDLVVCEEETQMLEVEYTRNFQATFGTGTTVSGNNDNNTAFNNRFTAGKSQLLFTAAELNEAGIAAGNISSLSFNIATPGSRLTNANYIVKIATTALNAFASSAYVTTGLTTVYGPSTYTHTDSGWQEIVFATPYVWDGTSNIIVEISHTGADLANNANTYYTAGTENRLLFGTTGTPTQSKNRYNVVFKGERDYKVTWSPATNVYTDAAGTVPYVAGTSAKKVYYKGQTEGYEDLVANVSSGNGCPLVKTYTVRTVIITDAVAEDQEFCGAVRISDLVATGQEGAAFKWYRQATGGVVLAPTTIVTTGTYFVTQIIGNCESTTRVPVEIVIKVKPTAPISPNRNICGTAVLSDLEVTYDTANTLNWYDANQNLIVGDIALQTGVYYVSQSNTVCESDRTRVNISVNPVPGIPTATATQIYCGTARVSNLAVQMAPGAVANWYTSMDSNVVLSPNDFLRTGTYYVAQSSNGCESTRIAVNVSVYETVAMPTAQNQNFCTATATVRDLQVTTLPGAQVKWYNVATGGVALGDNQNLSSGLYYVAQKIGDCESARVRIGVNIVSNTTAPNARAQAFCGEAKVSDLQVNVATGMIVKWYKQAEGGAVLTDDALLQSGTYYVSQSIYYCESPRKAIQVTINPIPAAPNGNALQEFEEAQNSVIANLVLDKNNVVWYSSEEDALLDNNRLAANMPLINGNVYYGVVHSAAGCPSLPFAVTVKINPTLGVNDFDLTKLNYYPNPVKDILTITYKETIVRVEVYALTGQRVLTQHASDNIVLVDMSRLATATYVVKIYTDSQTQFVKIVKH
ncbi:T9SS type A sorting domain-containing protein [Flavobacterium sp. NKUCC04_CG]|uniref:Ig-like domain-containing protein n=1 Tax=Flavobacterium sp. NKUCC04_CG TaxID=2842121 RepID=UPI001C5BC78E|nr:T9SS type A sorting domain-containing protein [Flavobacterium sp. NKUCC04_CG]MBW3517693.1 T9SS type A sorting domain-containing protein [Flavobacterium sp. NKUCC04_CG]